MLPQSAIDEFRDAFNPASIRVHSAHLNSRCERISHLYRANGAIVPRRLTQVSILKCNALEITRQKCHTAKINVAKFRGVKPAIYKSSFVQVHIGYRWILAIPYDLDALEYSLAAHVGFSKLLGSNFLLNKHFD